MIWISRYQIALTIHVVLLCSVLAGCSRPAPNQVDVPETPAFDTHSTEQSLQHSETNAGTGPGIVRWEIVPPLTHDVGIMETVFWEPADTKSLRDLIFRAPEMKQSRVLEVGTGSGLISLCCLHAGAENVVATDLNPNAVQNVRFNAANMKMDARLDARLVPRRSQGAWTVIKPDEKFDFIISNPPWENQKPKTVEEFALYDPDFLLLDSLVSGARDRLKPGGRLWLAYGCVTAICRIEMLARREGLTYLQLDDRLLDELPEVFLPGMLLELTVPSE